MGYVTREQNKNAVSWKLVSNDDFMGAIKTEDLSCLNTIHRTFSEYRTNDLIKHTYLNYPFWAINSTIQEERTKVLQQKKQSNEKTLFTIGYEGVSLEMYINKLILNDIKALCDVRKNSYSQKWGFSKATLQDACEMVGIKFIHIPQLGIESNERRELNVLSDYKRLFASYDAITLVENDKYLLELAGIISTNHRVALTCFEKEVQMCHRGVVASKLMTLDSLKTFTRKDL